MVRLCCCLRTSEHQLSCDRAYLESITWVVFDTAESILHLPLPTFHLDRERVMALHVWCNSWTCKLPADVDLVCKVCASTVCDGLAVQSLARAELSGIMAGKLMR